MATLFGLRKCLRGARPHHRGFEMDSHTSRPRVRFKLPTESYRRSLRICRLHAEICERLRGRLEQGDEPRSVRSSSSLIATTHISLDEVFGRGSRYGSLKSVPKPPT